MLHMFGMWGSLEEISGNLDEVTQFDDPPFVASDWVSDNIEDLIPHITFKRPHQNGQQGTLVDVQLTPALNLPIKQVWHLRGRVQDTMLVHDAYVHIYSHQDAVWIEGSITNSDPSSPQIDETFDHIAVRTGERLELTHRDHFRLHIPWRSPKPNLDWHQNILLGKTISDGQQVLYSGWLLCLPTVPSILDPFDQETMLRLDSLEAYVTYQRGGSSDRFGGAVRGLGEWEDGRWLAHGKIPDAPSIMGRPVTEFREMLKGKRDLFDSRPLNLEKSAGQTGAQADFGATAGASVLVLNEPQLLDELWYNINEQFRPFHHRQPNGDPITKETNPLLWTWSQLPIGTTNPGPADDLGKGWQFGIWPLPREGTGYSGEDDQHRSQNVFNACYALTGAYTLKSILLDFFEIDRMQVPERIGAPRALGRLFDAWADMLLLLPPEKVSILEDHMLTRMDVLLRDWRGGHVSEDRPIRVISTAESPSTLVDAEGNTVEAWVVWEHAILARGMYAAAHVTKGELHDRCKWAARHFAELVAAFGNFFDGVNWRCCTAVKYRKGSEEGNPIANYATDSFDIHIEDGFWTWTLPAIKICKRLTPDFRLKDRCEAIITQVEGSGPQTWDQAEWWAV
jgi:hypothetical protein